MIKQIFVSVVLWIEEEEEKKADDNDQVEQEEG